MREFAYNETFTHGFEDSAAGPAWHALDPNGGKILHPYLAENETVISAFHQVVNSKAAALSPHSRSLKWLTLRRRYIACMCYAWPFITLWTARSTTTARTRATGTPGTASIISASQSCALPIRTWSTRTGRATICGIARTIVAIGTR